MDFLEEIEIGEWATERGLKRTSGSKIQLLEVEANPPRKYAHGRRSGLEAGAARDLVDALGASDERLVWITLWGVWRSGEDWPEFYAWRGSLGEPVP